MRFVNNDASVCVTSSFTAVLATDSSNGVAMSAELNATVVGKVALHCWRGNIFSMPLESNGPLVLISVSPSVLRVHQRQGATNLKSI